MLPWILFGYAVGSVPFAYLLARRAGVDVRVAGSGNVGAANVLRTSGTPLGLTVMILDIGKGAVSVLAAYAGGGCALHLGVAHACRGAWFHGGDGDAAVGRLAHGSAAAGGRRSDRNWHPDPLPTPREPAADRGRDRAAHGRAAVSECIAVLGAGSWGTALAVHCRRVKHEV